MPQTTLVPVNPAVVKWAIDQSGLPVEGIARRTNVAPEVVASWISGTGSPSKTQFALLAQAVKRPTSVFFLPAAPKVQTPSVKFRAPIGSRRTQPNSDERDSIATADRLQRLFAWLAERTDTRADLSRFKGPDDPDGAAGHVRDLIKVTPAQQRKWRDARTAWGMWRTTVEELGLYVLLQELGLYVLLQELGLYVLLQELGKDGIRAFALSDDSAAFIPSNPTDEGFVPECGVRVRVFG
jgi:transcriptional regulator with XRE-family HTH domain